MAARYTPKHSARSRQRSKAPVVVAIIVIVLAVGGVAWWALRGQIVCRLPAFGQADSTRANDNKAQSESNEQDQAEEGSMTSQETDKSQPTSRFAAMLAAGEVGSIRLVGDSITAGFGTDGYEDADFMQDGIVIYDNGAALVHHETSSEAVSWANAFRAYAAEHGVASFVNAGINGAFMMELARDPAAWLGDGADVVFVALGTNDAGYFGPDEFRAAAEEGLAAAAKASKLVVVVSPVNDLRPAEWLVEPATELGGILREISEQHGYEFVDMSDALTPEMFCDDGLHPNSEGSLAMWARIRQALGL